MFGSLGVPELIFIFALALLIFGPRKLPEIGRTIGRGLSEFRKASTELKRSINAEMIEEELRQSDPRKMMDEATPVKSSKAKGSSKAKSDAVADDQASSSAGSQDAAPPAGSVPRSTSGGKSSEANTAEASADSEAQ